MSSPKRHVFQNLSLTEIPVGLRKVVIVCVFRGLKAYLSKWKARGFDKDVKRLVSLLEAGSIAQAEQMVRTFTTLPLGVGLIEESEGYSNY